MARTAAAVAELHTRPSDLRAPDEPRVAAAAAEPHAPAGPSFADVARLLRQLQSRARPGPPAAPNAGPRCSDSGALRAPKNLNGAECGAHRCGSHRAARTECLSTPGAACAVRGAARPLSSVGRQRATHDQMTKYP